MKKRLSLALALLLAQSSALAQTPTQPTTTPPARTDAARREDNPYEDEVVRITTNLVQFDAVVTDKQGRLVADIRPEEFEVTVDGKRREVTNFSYVDLSGAGGAVVRGAEAQTKAGGVKTSSAPVPTARLRPEQVRRTIALVVDDLGLSFESVTRVRSSLKKFVDEQMQPGDLVAVIRTSAGVGALQQFTSDKAVLASAIERVRWYAAGGAGRTMTQAEGSNKRDNSTSLTDLRDTNDLLDRYREELFAAGTLGALNFVVRGLKELPGRKSVVLLSDGIPVFRKDGRSDGVFENLRRLVDVANRASVRIYSMDARGLSTFSITGEDNTSSLNSSAAINAASDERRSGNFESQNGLNYLADETGGLFIHNTNDVAEGVREVLQDQKGFYLIGYRPDAETFARGARRCAFISSKLRSTGRG